MRRRQTGTIPFILSTLSGYQHDTRTQTVLVTRRSLRRRSFFIHLSVTFSSTVRSRQGRDKSRSRTSPRAIREWQAEITRQYATVSTQEILHYFPHEVLILIQASNVKLVTGVLYPVDSHLPRSIRLPVTYNVDDDPRATRLVDDVRVKYWFPEGSSYTRVHNVPGSSMSLANDYTIITSAAPRKVPQNKSLATNLGCKWRGNILVLRHHQRYLMSVTNIHSSERKLVDFVLRQYASTVPARYMWCLR